MIFDINSIPKGDNKEDKKQRKSCIKAFYRRWGEENPSKKVFNKAIDDFIYVKHISVEETAGQASIRYESTLAVLYLSQILENAILVSLPKTTDDTKDNQKGFEKILIMEYNKTDFGKIKLVVGIKRGTKEKIQYCVMAIKNDQQS